MLKKQERKLLGYLILILLASLLIFWGGTKLDLAIMRQWVLGAGIWAPLVYTLLLVLTYVIAPLSGTPVFMSGFVLLGEAFVFYNYLAQLASAVINFWIARVWGRGLVIKLAGEKNMARVDRFALNYGLRSLVFLRLFMFLFHDFVSYAYGLTKIRFWPYFIVSALGQLPWFFVWKFFLLKQIETFGDFTFWFVVSIVPFWIIALFFFTKVKKKT